MAFDLTKVAIFGKKVHSPIFESLLHEAFQKTVPELIAVHNAVGIGSLCDWITLFEPETVKKIYPAEFLLDFDVDASQTLIVAESSDARTIAVSMVNDQFRYHLVDWKMEEVTHFDSLRECLQYLFEIAGARGLCEHLFLFSPTLSSIAALDLAWKRDEIFRLIHVYLDSLGTKWLSFTEGGTTYFYDSTQQFMIQMDESSQRPSHYVGLRFEKERHSELRALIQQWADHAKACNLPRMQMG